jgi:hypothetical protein
VLKSPVFPFRQLTRGRFIDETAIPSIRFLLPEYVDLDAPLIKILPNLLDRLVVAYGQLQGFVLKFFKGKRVFLAAHKVVHLLEIGLANRATALGSLLTQRSLRGIVKRLYNVGEPH